MVVALLLASAIQQSSFVHSKTDEYTGLELHGFAVLVSPAAMADKKATDAALGLLEAKLAEIRRVVPPAALEGIKDVKIWVERDNPANPGAVYHPSSEWLRQNGYNTDKARCVEIGNVRNFVEWSTKVQPMMVLHELAHAYHHQAFGYEDKAIKEAFRAVTESKSYESVLFVSGGEKRHYALTSAMEYFAESSEAYFGLNDFYPFNRWQLLAHDRPMFELLVKTWGLPIGQSMTIGTSATSEVLKSIGRDRA